MLLFNQSFYRFTLFWVCLFGTALRAGDNLNSTHIVNCGIRLVRESSPRWLRNPRILFVGDYASIKAHLLKNLETAGMKPEFGWLSSEAELERSLTEKWSLIVVTRTTDAVSPEKVLEILKGKRRRVPVVIMVDSPDQTESIESAFKAGATDYVTRYNFQRFAQTVVHELRAAHEQRELRRLRQRRRQAVDDLSLIFNLSRELLFVGTADGIASTVNPAYLKVLQYSEKESMELRLLELVHADDRKVVSATIDRMLADPQSSMFPIEVRMRRKDGIYRRIAWSFNVLRRNQGIVLGVGRDVTEAREREANERHEDKMRALGQLAAGVAHDFNNLLTIILGYGEFVSTSLAESDPSREMMNQVLAAGNRAAQLVARISKFGRKETYSPRPTLLSDSVAEALNLMRPTYPRTIELVATVERSESTVMVDAPLLVQVIVNIANNARDAIGKRAELGRIKFTVREVQLNGSYGSVDGLVPAGTYMSLQIADNGSGIDKEIIPRLFEHYFTTKPVGEGTGLGLAIAHGFVRDHKGWISVKSEKGVGTTFELLFPSLPGTAGTATGKLSDERPLYRDGKGKRVLLVDDEGPVRQLFRLMLEPENYAVTLAADGNSAWELFLANPASFDLVITDLHMPNLNGFQLADKIRAEGVKVPILLLTGNKDMVSRADVLTHGIDSILGKPSPKIAFMHTVEKLLVEGQEAD